MTGPPDHRLDEPDTAPASTPGSFTSGGWEVADLVAAGVLDVIPGDPPVPVSVWRATGPQDPPATPGQLFTGLTPRLAAMLLAVYTEPGQTIIDTTSDPAIAGAAGAGARHYLAMNLPATTVQPHRLARRAGMILLRWPPLIAPAASPHSSSGSSTADDPDPAGVLDACAGLLHDRGHTVVLLAPPAGLAYRDYARAVIPAASQAGLGYLQHLVVITGQNTATATTATDQLELAAHDRTGDGTASGLEPVSRTAEPPVSQRQHLDMLVFILKRGTRP